MHKRVVHMEAEEFEDVVVEVLKKSSGRFNYAISKSIVIVAREALSSPELSTFWFGGSEPLKPIRTSTEDEELKAWKALPRFSGLSFEPVHELTRSPASFKLLRMYDRALDAVTELIRLR